LDAKERAQQRRFSRPVGAEYRDDFALGKLERNAANRVDASVADV
jgi:hypothetical protein